MPIKEQLILEGKDQTQNALNSVQRRLQRLDRNTSRFAGSLGGLQNAILGVAAAFGGMKVAGSFLDTARQLENLKFQLAALTGSSAEAAKAMEILSDFAGTVPFQLQDIQLAAPSLLAVANSTEELNELLAITGDIAAASGLDFQTVALQLQRTFSAGIASADLFRDRAVKSMLGFQEGVQYSAEQSRELIVNGFRDGTITIAGASADMAQTFDGSVSMIQDKFFQFQKAVMDSGPFDALKATAKVVDNALVENFGSIEEAAAKIGDAIVSATIKALLFAGNVIDQFKPVFDFIGDSIANLVNFVKTLPPPIDTIGIIGFLALGGRGKLVVGIIAGVFDTVRGLMGDIIGALGTMYAGIARTMRALKLIDEDKLIAAEKAAADMHATSDRLNTSLKDLADITGDAGDKGIVTFEGLGVTLDIGKMKADGMTESILKMIERVDEMIIKSRQLNDVLPPEGETGAPGVNKETADTIKEILEPYKEFIRLGEQYQNMTDMDPMIAKYLEAGEALEELKEAQEKIRFDNTEEGVQAYLDLQKSINAAEQAQKTFGQAVVEAIDEPYKTRRQLLDEALQDELYMIEFAHKNRYLTEEEYNLRIERARAQHSKEIQKIEQETLAEIENRYAEHHRKLFKMRGVSDSDYQKRLELEKASRFDQGRAILDNTVKIFDALGQENKKAFQAYKAFAIAQAIIDSIASAQSAFKAMVGIPFVGPALAVTAAGAALAAGYARVNAIRSQTYGGRREGGPVTGGSPFLVGEAGVPEVFTPRTNGEITPLDKLMDRQQQPVQVVFQIQANDTRGFDDLIKQRRGLIVNMINDAVMNKGKEALI